MIHTIIVEAQIRFLYQNINKNQDHNEVGDLRSSLLNVEDYLLDWCGFVISSKNSISSGLVWVHNRFQHQSDFLISPKTIMKSWSVPESKRTQRHFPGWCDQFQDWHEFRIYSRVEIDSGSVVEPGRALAHF